MHERATTDAAASGMGTTITVALVEPDGARGVRATSATRARTCCATGASSSSPTTTRSSPSSSGAASFRPQEAEVHPQRSVITRALGTDPDVDVDTFSIEARPGDVFLICSDGLSSMVDGGEIEQIMSQHRGDLDGRARRR